MIRSVSSARSIAGTLSLMVLVQASISSAADDLWPKYEARCNTVLRQIATGQFAELESEFNTEMKKAVPASKLALAFNPLREQLGDFDGIVAHYHRSTPGNSDYTRFELWAKFVKDECLLKVDVVFDKSQEIAGLILTPTRETSPPSTEAAVTPLANYRTKTQLALPFRGEWTVVHGGRTVEQNHHAGNRNQRYGYDFWLADETGARFRSDGTKNNDYLAFDQPILAPGDGTVVQVIDGVEDNVPAKQNPYAVPENLVVIDHHNGEYSFLAHFKQGSIKVKVGQRIKRQELLGLCGNSGNSSEPHIHYHLADAPLMQDGNGLPARFHQIAIDGKLATNALLVRNNRVSNKLQE